MKPWDDHRALTENTRAFDESLALTSTQQHTRRLGATKESPQTLYLQVLREHFRYTKEISGDDT